MSEQRLKLKKRQIQTQFEGMLSDFDQSKDPIIGSQIQELLQQNPFLAKIYETHKQQLDYQLLKSREIPATPLNLPRALMRGFHEQITDEAKTKDILHHYRTEKMSKKQRASANNIERVVEREIIEEKWNDDC